MVKEDVGGFEKVAATSKKSQNDDHLPFLKTYGNFKFGSRSATQQARKRGEIGPMDKIFQ
jgi:hypothetical protein